MLAVSSTWPAGTALYRWGLLGDSAPYHDFHHTVNLGNFGAEYLDHMFGTMDKWLQQGGTQGYLARKRAGVVGNVLNEVYSARSGLGMCSKKGQ